MYAVVNAPLFKRFNLSCYLQSAAIATASPPNFLTSSTTSKASASFWGRVMISRIDKSQKSPVIFVSGRMIDFLDNKTLSFSLTKAWIIVDDHFTSIFTKLKRNGLSYTTWGTRYQTNFCILRHHCHARGTARRRHKCWGPCKGRYYWYTTQWKK